MYEISTAYKNYIANNLERDYKVKLIVGTDEIDSNDIFSYSLETSQPSDKFTIGNSISQVLKIEIKNQEKPFYNNQLYLQVGMLVNGVYEYVPIGYFNVDKSEKKDHRTTITAYDNMYKLEGLYVCELGSSKTISSIMSDITSKTRVQFAEFSYNNYSIPEDIVGYSYREVISIMAGLNGGNAYIDRTGKIKFVYLSDRTTRWAINDYYLFDGNRFKEQSYTIDKVVCYKDKDTSWSNGNLGTTPMTIEYENPFMTQAIAKDIYDKLANINYQAFNMETMSYLALDVGDWITYTAQDNTVYSLCIQHYKFNGGIKQTLESKTDGNKDNFNASGSLTQKVNRTITDLLAAKKAIIDKANISDLVAGKILFNTMSGGSATIQDILTQFIGGDDGQFLHLTSGNVVIDEAVIKDLIASKIKVSDLLAGNIDSERFNIVSKNGNLIIKDNTIQIKDSNRVRIQIGKDASGDYTLNAWDKNGKLLFNSNGITEDAIKNSIIRDDMVANNANINGKKLDIDSLITEVNNNNTKTIKGSKILIDATGQNAEVSFKQLTSTVDNLKSVNLVSYNTDNWMQGDINASTGVEGSSEYYIKTNYYIPVTKGKYTTSKYDSNNFDLYVLFYDSSKKFVRGLGLVNDMTYTTSFDDGFIKLMVRKKIVEPRQKINITELKNYKFKVEIGEKSSEFSYNPEDVGKLTHTLQTGFNIQQGQINQLIKDTTITEQGSTKTLKDAYNETKNTVDGTVQTVAKHETKINSINATNLLSAGGGVYLNASTIKWNHGNFTSTDLFVVENGWYRLYNTRSYSSSSSNSGTIFVINNIPIKAPADKKISISCDYYCNDSNGKLDRVNAVAIFILEEHNSSGSFSDNVQYIVLDKVLSPRHFKYTFTLNKNCTRYKIRFESHNNALNTGEATAFRFRNIMVVNGEIPASEWSPSFEDLQTDINSIESAVSEVQVRTTDEAFSVQVQKNQNRKFNIRYIRDYCSGSTSNDGCHWVEIQAITNFGSNLAKGKSILSNKTIKDASYITDGDYTNYNHYGQCNKDDINIPHVQIDLGAIYNNVDEIKIWHYYADGRTYNKTKTMVSADGTHWITLFDSASAGEYIETQYGHTVKVNGTSFNGSLFKFNENGGEIYEGALRIFNKAKKQVFGADDNGDLNYIGRMEQRDPVTGYLATSLKHNGLGIYDWRRKDDLTGGIVATEMTVSKRGAVKLFADKGNILSIGYREGDGTEEDFSNSQFTSVMLVDDTAQEEQGYVTSFYKSMAFFNDPSFKNSVNIEGLTHHYNDARYYDYSDVTLYGNDHNVPITTLGNGYTNNNVYLMAYKAGGNSVNLGARDGNTFYSYMNCNSGGTTTYGNIACTGTKLRAVKTKDFGILGQNAYETAEPYFGDLMFAKTSEDGYCVIPFDDKFLETVNTKYRYHVMYSIYGADNDIFPVLKCIEQTENYFIIKSDIPNVEFSVEVKCRQLGYEADRLEQQDIRINNLEADFSELENNYKDTLDKDEYLNQKIYDDEFLE